jgi:hypothetical protein
LIAPGVLVEGVEVRVVDQSELWSTYSLDDGTVIRLKHAVVRIFRLVDRYTPEGDPVYSAQTQAVTCADSPANLRAQPPSAPPMGASLA